MLTFWQKVFKCVLIGLAVSGAASPFLGLLEPVISISLVLTFSSACTVGIKNCCKVSCEDEMQGDNSIAIAKCTSVLHFVNSLRNAVARGHFAWILSFESLSWFLYIIRI